MAKKTIHRSKDSAATARGHIHTHGPRFVTRIVAKDKDGQRVITYRHRPGSNRVMPSQHQRVLALRTARDSRYMERVKENTI